MPLVSVKCHSHTTLVKQVWEHLTWLTQQRGCSAKSLVHFASSEHCCRRLPSGTVRTSYKSLSPSKKNPTSIKLMQHLSLPLPLISCFHKRHACPWPNVIEVNQPNRCQTRGVLPIPLSSGCDSGSALSISQHFAPWLLGQTKVYRNTAAQSSLGLVFMNQWNMLQTLQPTTPFPGSTLAFAHNSLLSS